MGTRGLRVYRFRKRYYAIYNHWDSYPEGFGKKIVSEIPTDASEYKAWLEAQRALVAEWEAEYLHYITVMPGNKMNSLKKKSERKATGEEGSGQGEDEQEKQEDNTPEWRTAVWPSLFAPLNDTSIEYTYITDLDNETFTINNGAHFPLERMPHIDWMSALRQSSSFRTQFVLPDMIPQEKIVHLVATKETRTSEEALSSQLDNLTITKSPDHTRELVTAKGIDSIPWYICHGAVLRSLWFYFWSVAQEDVLAATLLQLRPSDLPFREMAYAILCMAAGGKNATVVPKSRLANNPAFGLIKNGIEYGESSEYFSVLGSGSHREGELPGSAPQETVYWLEGVLIVLWAQLYQKDELDRALTFITQYCQVQCADIVVDAILISIEHAVLVHLGPGSQEDAKIQHTAPLPLVEIEEHLTMRATDRYTASYLSHFTGTEDEKFQKRQQRKRTKAMQESMLKNEGISMSFGNEEDEVSDEDEPEELLESSVVGGPIASGFLALYHIFSSVACRRLRPKQQGCFPTEIYRCILSHVIDATTRDACLHTSHILRELCLREYLLCEADATFLCPSESLQGCTEPEHIPGWWVSLNTKTGEESVVDYRRGGCSFMDFDKHKDWTVLVGSGYGRKSLVQDVTFKFVPKKD